MPSVLSRPVMVRIRSVETEKAKQIKLAHFQERLEVYGPYLIECPKCQRVFVGESDGEAINRWSAHMIAKHHAQMGA